MPENCCKRRTSAPRGVSIASGRFAWVYSGMGIISVLKRVFRCLALQRVSH